MGIKGLVALSREIPAAVKREVRQRCSFGCIFCGNPFVEYHHIDEYHELKDRDEATHAPDRITLLCPTCHHKATVGLIPRTHVDIQVKNPRNRSVDRTAPEVLFYDSSSADCVISMGGATLTNPRPLPSSVLCVRGQHLIWFRWEAARLLLSADIRDEHDSQLVRIRKNELSFTTKGWDITFVGKTLSVTSPSKESWLRMTFGVPHTVTVERANLWCNGTLVTVRGDEMTLRERDGSTSKFRVLNARYCPVLAAVGPISFSLPDDE